MTWPLSSPVSETSDFRYAWYVVFVLMLCYTLSFVDRQILAFLVGPIKRDLGVTDTQMGLLGGLVVGAASSIRP